MCRIEEKLYVHPNGQMETYQDEHTCSKVRPGQKYCNNVKRTKYQPPPLVSHDHGSSPASTAPSTPPAGTTGGYIVQTRRPSDAGRRSSISEKKIRPEIIITLGSSRKDKDKKYGSSKSYKRSSLSGSYAGSNDYALDSPGSEASYTMRTGLPEAQIDTIDHPAYGTRPLVPNQHHNQHHGSSASSFTSSQTPSLVAFSDPDSPTLRQFPRYPPTIVHQQHPPQGTGPTTQATMPTVVTSMPSQSRGYRTHVVAPATPSSRDNFGHDINASIDPFDYIDRSPSPPLPPRNVPVSALKQRGTYQDRVNVRAGNEPRSRQEAADYDKARRLQKEEDKKATAKTEEAKQVRFELGRYDTRAELREENKRKEKEKEQREREKERQDRDVQERERKKRDEILQRQKEKALAQDRAELEQKKREDAERLRREEAKLRQREKQAKEEREEREEREREKRREETKRQEKEVKRLEKEAKADQAKSRGRRENRDNRPPLSGTNTRPGHRRRSLSRADMDERKRLLDAENQVMHAERVAADQRERDEQAATLLEQQQKPEYYDPRGGNRQVITNEAPNLGRRNSVATRPAAITQAPPPAGLNRRESTRRSSVIVQSAPPNGIAPINTSMPPPQSTQGHIRPPPSATRPNPPQFLAQPPAQPTYAPAPPNPSARHHSYGQGDNQNPFAQPPGRLSNTSQDNPYSQLPPARLSNTSQDNPNPFTPLSARHSPNMPARDPWDAREASNVQAPPMHARQPSEESQNTLRRRGEEYLVMTSGEGRTHGYDRSRPATHKTHHAYEHDDR